MAVTRSTSFSSSTSFHQTTTFGDQSQTESYFLNNSKTIPTGTGGTPTSYFNEYAKFTGLVASGETITIDFSGVDHQAITGGDITKSFTHINTFYFEPTSSTGVDDTYIVKATGTDAFTNLFYGGSGGPSGHPVRAYSPFNYVDYYGTAVAGDNRLITIYNSSDVNQAYKYMVVGFTGTG
jgi:hypothetical protein|tara:strand:+ start:795 stop:1334 length:540 start_codon:yes stop_codon:yes gene_type:complete